MDLMFASSLFDSDMSKWNTVNVVDMSGMFSTTIFNGNISHWNTSKVQKMTCIFAFLLFNGELNQWDTGKVINMDFMFEYCPRTVPWWFIENNKKRTEAIKIYIGKKRFNAIFK